MRALRLRVWAAVPILFCTAVSANDGNLDPSFGSGGLALAGVSAVDTRPGSPVVQPDGKILVCGTRANADAPGSDFLVARFTANGGLDTTFGAGGKIAIDFNVGDAENNCRAIALQRDGKIVLAGYTYMGENVDFAIARLNSDGSSDTSFGAGIGKMTLSFDLGGDNADVATALAIQENGRIVIGGYARTVASGTDFAIARLLPDGSLDSSFNQSGKVTVGFDLLGSTSKNDYAEAVAIDATGRIIVGGRASASGNSSFDFAVARLLPNGQLDPDFDADGRATIAFDLGASGDDEARSLTLQPDGKIVLGGIVDTSLGPGRNYDIAATRLLPNGLMDSSFGIGGMVVVPFDLIPNGMDFIWAVDAQRDGKLVLAGGASAPNQETKAAIIRLNRDGNLDGSYGDSGKRIYDFGLTSPSEQYFAGIAFQGTNIIVAGSITLPGTYVYDYFVTRLQGDLLFADGFE